MRAILPRTPGRTPASSTAPALFPTGEIVGRYQVEAVIGLGGTGTVFRCFDKERGVLVAVKAIPHDATVDDRLLGTVSYMAPELCTGSTPTPSSDIWSVGVMLYEAMTGANPFRARSPAELADRHGERPRPLAEVRPDLGRPLAAAC